MICIKMSDIYYHDTQLIKAIISLSPPPSLLYCYCYCYCCYYYYYYYYYYNQSKY